MRRRYYKLGNILFEYTTPFVFQTTLATLLEIAQHSSLQSIPRYIHYHLQTKQIWPI